MASFEQIVSDQLCKMNSTLEKIKLLNERWEDRETVGIVFFTIPETGGNRSFAIGTTKINFKRGLIQNPDGTLEYMNRKLDQYSQEWLHSISIDADQDIKLKILPNSARTIVANFSTQIPYLNYNEVEITCTVATNIKIFACTNPSAVIGQFKGPADMTQGNITGDTTEATTWDTVYSLLNNMNRIRNQIIAITGEAWGTVSHSIATIWGKFNATTGHKHTGAADDAPKLPVTSVTNAESTANKNAANGYAGLDASAKFAGLLSTDVAATIAGSSYTGNGTANRAIPHGLGRTPKIVFLQRDEAGYGHAWIINGNLIVYTDSGSTAKYAVTAADSTNFYVGNSAQYDLSMNGASGATHYWVAI
ncbi:MAG: hypothetical protein FIB08_07610 [Candidatus Methanoperedens sp.]|nr:hypothetical protein [Candidatus Methanoperedens sp.]